MSQKTMSQHTYPLSPAWSQGVKSAVSCPKDFWQSQWSAAARPNAGLEASMHVNRKDKRGGGKHQLETAEDVLLSFHAWVRNRQKNQVKRSCSLLGRISQGGDYNTEREHKKLTGGKAKKSPRKEKKKQ